MHPTQKPVVSAEPDTDVRLTPAVHLRHAAGYLTVYGWHQDGYYGNSAEAFPPACAAGAIQCAVAGEPVTILTDEQDRAVTLVFGVLADYLNDPADDDLLDNSPVLGIIADWNDAVTQTADNVILGLYEAADDWDRSYIGGGA